MEPHHHLVAVIFVLHTEDAMRLMQFLATVHMSKLKMTRTPRVTAPFYEWIWMRTKSEPRAQPLWQHLGLGSSPAHPDGRIKFRAFAPFSVIDLGEGTLNLTKAFSAFHPTIKAFSERRNVLQYIECEMDPAAVAHPSFGVTKIWSNGDGVGGRGGAISPLQRSP
jgi:hypothetical protein